MLGIITIPLNEELIEILPGIIGEQARKTTEEVNELKLKKTTLQQEIENLESLIRCKLEKLDEFETIQDKFKVENNNNGTDKKTKSPIEEGHATSHPLHIIEPEWDYRTEIKAKVTKGKTTYWASEDKFKIKREGYNGLAVRISINDLKKLKENPHIKITGLSESKASLLKAALPDIDITRIKDDADKEDPDRIYKPVGIGINTRADGDGNKIEGELST